MLSLICLILKYLSFMKIFTCFYLISILLYNGNAQTSIYHPFPESDAVWNFQSSSFCWFPISGTEFYSIIITGDTIINNLTYHKLHTPYSEIYPYGVLCVNNVGNQGYIRQNVLERKVYYIPHSEDQEKLLYDFNLTIGDSIKGYLNDFIPNDYANVVQSIDSVFVDNGYRKRWNIDTTNYFVSIIEGIGSTYGLKEPLVRMISEGASFELTCFSQNGHTLYPDSNANCEIISSIEYINKKPINIYPNPSNGSFYIHNYDNPYSKFDLEIVDLNGHILEITEYKGDTNNPVFFLDIPDGLYFIRMMEDGVFKNVEKLVIKH